MKELRERCATPMRRSKRRNAGFTLAELLAVLGLLAILSSVGMLAVNRYQASLKRTELDGLARQIFLAAQNNLTRAQANGEWAALCRDQAQGYFGMPMTQKPADYPQELEWPQEGSGDGHAYFSALHTDGAADPVLQQLLPVGAIDEQVRGGSYLVEYDQATGQIYGVFFTDAGTLTREDVAALEEQGGRTSAAVRQSYRKQDRRFVVGYYGGAAAQTIQTSTVETPVLTIENGDRLRLVMEAGDDQTLHLCLTGRSSGAQAGIVLEPDQRSAQGSWELVLDDITQAGSHFADLFPDFWPGEDLLVEVYAQAADGLGRSESVYGQVNSLFAERTEQTDDQGTFAQVTIASLRHLQNLSPEVSNLAYQEQEDRDMPLVRRAVQTADLDAADFLAEEEEDWSVVLYDPILNGQRSLEPGCVMSILNPALQEYDGGGCSLTGLSFQENAYHNAGLFAQVGVLPRAGEALAGSLFVHDLILVEPSATATGCAGAVIGRVEENGSFTGENLRVENPKITVTAPADGAESGAAGGLAGSLAGGSLRGEIQVEEPEVSAENGDAGGLAGRMKSVGLGEQQLAVTEPAVTVKNGSAGGAVGRLESTGLNGTIRLEAPQVNAENGNAGGFAGELNSSSLNGTVQLQAPQVNVKNGNAGGIAGQMENSGLSGSAQVSDPVVRAENGSAGGAVGSLKTGSLKSVGVLLQGDNAAESYRQGAWAQGQAEESTGPRVMALSGGAAGGLAGHVSGNSLVENCFASVPVRADGGSAGGLLGRTEGEWITLNTSYAGGFTTAEGEDPGVVGAAAPGGVAGGLVGSANNTGGLALNNCFATVSSAADCAGGLLGRLEQGKLAPMNTYALGSVTAAEGGAYLGKLAGGWVEASGWNRYLEQNQMDNQPILNNVQASDFQGLIQLAGDQAQTGRRTVGYGRAGQEYPFPMVNNTAMPGAALGFYGDWPREVEQSQPEVAAGEAGLVYYEVIDGELYYHGYLTDFTASGARPVYREIWGGAPDTVKGLLYRKGVTVQQEGYLFLLPKGTDPALVGYSESNDVNGTSNIIPLNKSEVAERFVLEGSAEFDRLSENYDLYRMVCTQGSWANYVKIGRFPLNGDGTPQQWHFQWVTTWQLRSEFADAIARTDDESVTHIIHLRSERQLRNVGKYCASFSNSRFHFEQSLDIRLDSSVPDTGDAVTGGQLQGDYYSGTELDHYASGSTLHYSISGATRPLFHYLPDNTQVTGVTILDSSIQGRGALAPSGSGSAVVKDCTVGSAQQSVRVTMADDSYESVGGLLGYNMGRVEHCTVYATVSGGSKTGGLAGENQGTITDCSFAGQVSSTGQAGGLVAVNQGAITNCTVQATVTGGSQAGGLLAYSQGAVTNCSFAGDVAGNSAAGLIWSINGIAVQNSTANGTVTAWSGNGAGLVGEANGGSLTDCVFEGTVTASGSAAGLAGSSSAAIQNSRASATVTAQGGDGAGLALTSSGSLTGCSFTGQLQAAQRGAGLVWSASCSLTDCSFLGTVTAGGDAPGLLGESSATVTRCIARAAQADPQAYRQVQVISTGASAAGFVYRNTGSITDSYVVGTVESAADAAGFCLTNGYGGSLQRSYANVRLEAADGRASGMVQHTQGSVTNCFVTGSIESETGETFGFVGIVENGSVSNCYTAPFLLRGKTVYRFAQNSVGDGCYWLENYYLFCDALGTTTGAFISYDALEKEGAKESPTATYPYRSDGLNIETQADEYPFPTYGLDFWGDWPKQEIINMDGPITSGGVVYFERIGGRLYYHGYNTVFDSAGNATFEEVHSINGDVVGISTDPNRQVTERGYMLMVPRNTGNGKFGFAVTDGPNDSIKNKITWIKDSDMQNNQYLMGYKTYALTGSGYLQIGNQANNNAFTAWATLTFNQNEVDSVKPWLSA